jgi:zinc transport system substrate-binding protein
MIVRPIGFTATIEGGRFIARGLSSFHSLHREKASAPVLGLVSGWWRLGERFGRRAVPIALSAVTLLVAGAALAAEGPPRVVASVLPLQALAAGVMEGVAKPALLIPAASSPHTFALRPSNAIAIASADVVIWIGEGYETALAKPMRSLAASAQVLTLADEPDLVRYPYRSMGNRVEPDDHDADHAGIDPHLWLDPENGRRIAALFATRLSAIDPANAGRYRANAERLTRRIEALDRELEASLRPYRDRPFVVLHDAYQYFERRYGLTSVGAILIEPERSPGARRLRQIREQIRSLGAACVFAEPQFPKAIATTVADGLARIDVLDPLGSGLESDADAYVHLLQRLGGAIAACLGR